LTGPFPVDSLTFSNNRSWSKTMLNKLQMQVVGAIWMTVLACNTGAISAQERENPFKRMLKPNPNSPTDLMELLQNPEVAKEVGVDPVAINQITARQASMYREKRIAPPTDPKNVEERNAFLANMKEISEARNELIKQAIEELLPPEKLERLKQIAYRFETQKMGFADSLTDGWLADVVETHDAQQSTLTRKINDIEVELQKKIDALRAEAEVKILAELSPQQRDKARKALGEPLTFRAQSTEDLMLNRTREMIKTQARLKLPQ
jgi:hypothetical protein